MNNELAVLLHQIYVESFIQIFKTFSVIGKDLLLSLVKTFCYPESTKFYSKACDYGLTHKADAMRMYKDSMQATYPFLSLKSVG